MKNFKNILLFLIRYTIRLVLFAFVTTSVIFAIAGKNNDIKDVLNQTNSYERFVPAVIEANQEAKPDQDSIDYSDPNIIRIFTESFPAEDLKRNGEAVIDGVYNWLGKRTPNLQFTADFTKNKQLLAEKMSFYAFARLDTLPVCTTPPEEVNPLTISCKPKGYNRAESQESYRQQVLTSTDFLSSTVITAQDLPKNAAGKNVAEQYAYAPIVFTWLKRAPYILGSLLLLQAIGYVLLNPKKRRGVSGLGSILMGAGFSLAIFPIIYDIVIPYITKSYQASSTGSGTQAIFSDIAGHITTQFNTLMITVGLQMVAAGLTLYLLEKVTRKESSKYKDLSNRSGIASSISRVSPKTLKGKLSNDNVPVQSSDKPAKTNPKKVAENNKYRKLYEKKGL